MKITVQLIIEAAVTVFLVIACLVSWFSASGDREQGLIYRQIREAQVTESPNQALEPLEKLVGLRPADFGVQMSLAGLYLRNNKLDDAARICEQVAAADAADGGLRALAEVHLGMIAGAGLAKAKPAERAAKLALATRHFQAALKLDAPYAGKLLAAGDACLGLGLAALWAGRTDEAEKRLTEALKDDRALGAESLAEIHNGLGLVAAARDNMVEAKKHFDAARTARKDWKVPAANLKIIEEGKVGAAEMDPAVRKRLLAELAPRAAALKDPEAKAALLNALGCGCFYLGDAAGAEARLEAAVKLQPERADWQVNLLAARWVVLEAKRAALAEAAGKARPPQKEDALKNLWTTPVGKQHQPVAPKPENSPEMALLHKAEKEFAAAEEDFDRVAAEVLAKAAPPAELEAALVLVRAESRMRAAEAAEKDKAKADKLLAEAGKMLAEAAKKFPADARISRLEGVRLLSAGQTKEALEALGRSLAANAEQPDVRAVIAEFSKPVEVVSFRPAAPPGRDKSAAILASSSRPLLGALFRTNAGPTPLAPDKIRLTLDGRAVTGSFWGTEYLSLPEENLTDGPHELKAEAEDALGHKASGATRFLVDASPPEVVSTEPADGGATKGPRPRLVLTCRDKYSGVDPTSLEVELRSGAGAMTVLTEYPVRGGRYTFDYKGAGVEVRKGALAGEEKKGDPAGEIKFVFCPSHNLGPGAYQLTVSVGDQRGLKVTKAWKFVVEE